MFRTSVAWSRLFMITVQASRNLRAESKLPSKRKIRFILRTNENSILEQIAAVARLLNAEEVTVEPEYQAPPGTPVAVTPVGEIFLPIAAADQGRERERLDNEIARIEADLRTVDAKLQNDAFVERLQRQWSKSTADGCNRLNAQLAKLKQAREGLS